MKKIFIRISGVVCATFLMSGQASAVTCSPTTIDACTLPSGGTPIGSASRTDTRIYTGFVWELGGKQDLTPMFEIGVRSLTIRDNDHVEGADANLRIRYDQSITIDSGRIAYVRGMRDFMHNLGGGYSKTDSSWFATAAIQSAYTRLGTDYLLDNRMFKFYGELNTLDTPAKVVRPTSEMTCPGGGALTSVGADSTFSPIYGGTYSVDPGLIRNGYTCVIPAA